MRAPSRRGSCPCSGFSLAYLEDAAAGAAALDEALVVAEGTGEPEAIVEAHVRRAELLAGPLNRLEEGIAYARTGLERMRALGLARTAGRRAAHLRGQRAVPDRASGRRRSSAVAEAWKLRPTGAAALDVRLARCRIDLGRGHLDAAAADLEAVELLARSTTGPRQRIPLLVLFSALALWRRRRRWRCGTSRTGSPWSRRARTTSGRWPRWCGTRPGPGPTS